jgi:hypothetical protein
MAAVEMETCSRCQERWFEMDLKHNVCHRCSNRDKGNKIPFLMSVADEMDPGELPAHLPELTQVGEMIIARSHVQMLVRVTSISSTEYNSTLGAVDAAR